MADNKKIKTAIIGLGKIAWAYEKDPLMAASDDFPTHFRVLKSHSNFSLVAAQDKNAEARESFSDYAKGFGLDPEMYGDWEVMIKNEKPGLLVVASNTESHYEICSRAIDLGVKNILCEKPISFSVKDAKRLVRKAEKSGCLLFVNYPRAFNPSYSDLVGKIKDGFLGKIQSFDVKYVRGIFTNGTHAIDLLLRMFGEVKSAKAMNKNVSEKNSADPTVSAAIEFKTGLSGYMHGLNGDFYNIFELDILGELGRVTITGDKSRLYMRSGEKGALNLVPGGENLIDTKIGHYPIYDNIYSCIMSGDKGKNKCSGQDGLGPLEIAGKIVKSIKSR